MQRRNTTYQLYVKRLLVLLPLLLLLVSPCAAKSLVKHKLLDVPASVVTDHRPFKDRMCSSRSYAETDQVRISQLNSLSDWSNVTLLGDLLPLMQSVSDFYASFYTDLSIQSDKDLTLQPYYILYRQLLFYS